MTWRSARPGIRHAFRYGQLSLCGFYARRDTRTPIVGDLTCATCERLSREALA